MRERAGWVLTGVWALLNLLITAGVGPSLDEDVLASTSIVVPGLAFVTVILVRPRSRWPARLLWSRPRSHGPLPLTELLRPCLPGLVAAAASIAAAYLGAAVSLLLGSARGAGPLLTAPSLFIDWAFFAAAGLLTTCLGSLVVLGLVLSLGAAMDARHSWATDRLESRRLLAFASASLGVIASMASLVLADPQAADLGDGAPSDRWAGATRSMRTFLSLLTGPSTSQSVTWAAWVARLAVGLLLVAVVLHWVPARETSRTGGSSPSGEDQRHRG